LGLKASADEFLIPLFDLIKAGLAAMAEAERAGALTIDEEGVIHLPALESLPADPEPVQHRTQLFKAIGDVQFPDLLLEVDAHTNFSEVLLGRKAYEEHELIAVYGALISHGTEIDAKSVAAMTPQLDPAHVTSAMRALESPGRLTRAIRRVVEFQQRHPITELWGKGELGSADMMSIDASRSLWTARTDPRRRTFAVGLYTHILDTYGVVHNQPVVLNERQAGPAIEGAVRHNETAATRLKRLAVDTHGYTYAGMTFANLCGFDLCPRLRDLKERKLFLPRKMDVPDGLDLVAVCDVSLLGIRKGWDELLRVAASIATGRTSATIVVKRLGSGDPVFRAADQLGRLLRTVFLCDYFSNAEFRREIHTVLNRGESAHQLQRAVYTGKIAPERGRRRDELMAISGSHALLTNAVVAWNTHRMQVEVDRRRKARQPIDDIWLARMGPLHFGHINFRGTFRFGIDRYRAMLINPRRTSVRRVSA
jgi:TnpA family transposase